MFNGVIRFALQNRLFVLALAVAVLGYGGWAALSAPIDVFPDLDRPRVVVLTEAPGLAPEEVESQITFPLETTLNGAYGVQAVRSTSAIGLSVIYVELDFGADVYLGRQIVNERLAMASERLPRGVRPQLAPISSIMGQILVLGMWSDAGETDPVEIRSQADWIVRQRLLTIPGVAQVFAMGGGRRQFQVLVDPQALQQYGVSLAAVRDALAESNANATGGYLDQQGPNEILVRSVGRIQSIADVQSIVVSLRDGRPVSLAQVARVTEGPQTKRGDASAFVRDAQGKFSGGPAVALTISKQPGADSRILTAGILEAIEDLRGSLGRDIRIEPLYAQRDFIDRALHNVLAALRDGAALVVVVLFLFLMNVRTTLISLTAIPLSLAVTILVFRWFGMSINTMTLGGLAVAIGELVDDAIVDVENIYRRLKENGRAASPLPALRIVYDASVEVRSSIVFSTIIVCLVFVPLFALSGMEGRLFAPLGTAYITSIAASLVVSLTVTPVLSFLLLPQAVATRGHEDGPVLRVLKGVARPVIRFSLAYPKANLVVVASLVGAAALALIRFDRDFLPPFNEGAVQLNVHLPPGVSLATATAMNERVEGRLQQNPDILHMVRRTGRAELDEHAEPVSASEYLLELNPDSPHTRAAQLAEIRRTMDEFPGVVSSVEQPISHLISHMLSGVKAQIGIKIFGDDLEVLRRQAEMTRAAIQEVEGVRDLFVEQQTLIPQLRIEIDRDKLQTLGLRVQQVNQFIETALNGEIVSEVLLDQRRLDLVVRLQDQSREDLETLRRLPIETPNGGAVPLESVARIYESAGPNVVHREQVRRRIVIQCNVAGRGVVDVAEEIEAKIAPLKADTPAGYYYELSGQFVSQQQASRRMAWLFGAALLGVFLTLYAMFQSVNLSLQVMAAIPMAFLGAVAALAMTGQSLTIASMVGFISLAGIASRNGILLLQHYLHLVKHEGESWSHAMIVRAGLERLAPVLMTALTAAIGLAPLALAAGEPGKEILYPVATVIVGGVVSSTLLDFLVHPALFWLFGLREGQRVVQLGNQPIEGFDPRSLT